MRMILGLPSSGFRLGLAAVAVIVAVGVGASVSFAQTSESGAPKLFANNDGAYTGGRGLITASGPTGMFLNPTSGTMQKGDISAQVFGSTIKPISRVSTTPPTTGKDQFAYYNALLGYGITDWLEVGGLAQLADRSNGGDQQSVMAGGGYARVRVLKDQGLFPELSVGGMFFEGNEILDRQTLFLAMSKRVEISSTGFLRGFRLHLGGLQLWQKDRTELTFKNWKALDQRGAATRQATSAASSSFRNISSWSARSNPGQPAIKASPTPSACSSVIPKGLG